MTEDAFPLPPVTLNMVRQAAAAIAGLAHRTPVVTCSALDNVAGCRLFLKCENFQKVGAFKFRGAANALANIDERELQRGVITHSSGNHAQALALAAAMKTVPATVVMPSNSPQAKMDAVRDYGARVVECEPTLASREETMERERAKSQAIFVPPFNDLRIIAGQGTAVLELLEEVPDLDVVIAPVGGGGLISGTAIAGKGSRPGLQIVAAEPAGADDAFRSKQTGELIPQTNPQTVCDGLLTSLGSFTWPIVRDRVDRIVVVDDASTIAAMRAVWQRAKLVIEPSAAVAVAAAFQMGEENDGKPRRKIGVILSGGNLDLDRLPWLNQ